MKGFVYFIIAVIVLAGFGSAFWWLADGSTPEEQLEYLKVTFSVKASRAALPPIRQNQLPDSAKF